MIFCKDNSGVCTKSMSNICCIDCKSLEECKERNIYCRVLRNNNTKELITNKCLFSYNDSVINKLIIKRKRTLEVANVQCTNCNKEFFKVLNTDNTYGKTFKFCPLCGCEIENERHKNNKGENTYD